MPHLFNHWPDVRTFLEYDCLYLFLDYDGTLTPIVSHPDKAKLSGEVRDLLSALKGAMGVRISIISGRSLEDVQGRVGVEGLTYVGNHGYEAQGPGVVFTLPGIEKSRQVFQKIYSNLSGALSNTPGVVIENKGLSLSVHYRNVSEKDFSTLEKQFQFHVKSELVKGHCLLLHGKKVWELRPPVEWNKGAMVLWLLDLFREKDQKTSGVFYIGDDKTDEDAFQALKKDGVTIRVADGPRQSAARFHLSSSLEVTDFLKRIQDVRRSKS
jgi:trehalose-phosphatase